MAVEKLSDDLPLLGQEQGQAVFLAGRQGKGSQQGETEESDKEG
ncbi:MAG: hypothetical protein AABZ09_01950 [Candidatus Binatota bacterium]